MWNALCKKMYIIVCVLVHDLHYIIISGLTHKTYIIVVD